PDAAVHARAAERNRQREATAVQPAAPREVAHRAVALGPLLLQQRLGLAVALLLLPVHGQRIAPVVPVHGAGMKADAPAARLQPPAQVDVVAGGAVAVVEAIDGG
ncbi:MAG: hypothetical protein ACK56I_18060, partial [bacterium]